MSAETQKLKQKDKKFCDLLEKLRKDGFVGPFWKRTVGLMTVK